MQAVSFCRGAALLLLKTVPKLRSGRRLRTSGTSPAEPKAQSRPIAAAFVQLGAFAMPARMLSRSRA